MKKAGNTSYISSAHYFHVLECLKTCIARSETPSMEQITDFQANRNRQEEEYKPFRR